MPPRSQLSTAPPYAVEAALQKLGGNLRTARLRRNLGLPILKSSNSKEFFEIEAEQSADHCDGGPDYAQAQHVL